MACSRSRPPVPCRRSRTAADQSTQASPSRTMLHFFLPTGRALMWGQLGWVGLLLGTATSSQYYLGIRVSFV